MIKGFLLGTDPKFGLKNDWGLDAKIKRAYDLPVPQENYDHDPSHDAYRIAYDFIVLSRITEGDFKKLNREEEEEGQGQGNYEILKWDENEKIPPVVTKQQMKEWEENEDTRWFIEEWKFRVSEGNSIRHLIIVEDEMEKEQVLKERKYKKPKNE
jgi:hypothetical protein